MTAWKDQTIEQRIAQIQDTVQESGKPIEVVAAEAEARHAQVVEQWRQTALDDAAEVLKALQTKARLEAEVESLKRDVQTESEHGARQMEMRAQDWRRLLAALSVLHINVEPNASDFRVAHCISWNEALAAIRECSEVRVGLTPVSVVQVPKNMLSELDPRPGEQVFYKPPPLPERGESER